MWTRRLLWLSLLVSAPQCCSGVFRLRSNDASAPDFNTWMNETLGRLEGSGDASRRLEEKDGAVSSKRLCARALKNMRDEEYQMSLPGSDRERYVPCMECTPTR